MRMPECESCRSLPNPLPRLVSRVEEFIGRVEFLSTHPALIGRLLNHSNRNNRVPMALRPMPGFTENWCAVCHVSYVMR